ncbi:uncharacterized protein LOC143286859 [Babylonia areolata]|uniref:uncharacterized protein LOC143286859 n=1 Tax=Babylonia areolata TaxID=304850 RepID=UPI003FD48E24
MSEEAAPDSAGRLSVSDRAESSNSPVQSDHCTVIPRHDFHPDKSPSSPGPQPQGEEAQHEHLLGNSSTDDGFRLDPSMSAHTFVSVGLDSQCDDLPLVFSLPAHEDDSSKVYSCHLCNFKTAFKNSLVNHQAVHSDARPWVCEICDYAAKRKQDLKKHLQTMHGMIVDSLSLKLTTNPQACVSSSSQSSPVDIKPMMVSSGVSGDGGSCAIVGYGRSHGVSSAVHTVPQQTASGFRQPLSSSFPLPSPCRSAGLAEKMKEDQVSGCQGQGDHKTANRFMANSSTDTGSNSFKFEFRKEFGSSHSSYSDSFLLQRIRGHKDEQFINSCSENASIKNCPQTESKDDRNIPQVSKMVSKHERRSVADDYASVNATTQSSHRYSDVHGSGGMSRSEPLSPYMTLPQHSGGPESVQRPKRVSVNSSDQVPVKAPRFQSPASDLECCPQVTSQSDRTINSEFISSTVAHSRALETKKSFHCAHCDILFFESAMYLMHAGLHDTTNPWKCSVCGRTFFEKYSFTSHFINQH